MMSVLAWLVFELMFLTNCLTKDIAAVWWKVSLYIAALYVAATARVLIFHHHQNMITFNWGW